MKLKSDTKIDAPDGANVTAGDNSPVIQGNKNTTATDGSVAISRFHMPSFVGGVASGVMASMIFHVILKVLP